MPAATAERVNATHDAGGRVVAIGTTVVRALESAVGPDGRARAADGWTELVITPERGVRLVDGLLTGWHEPEASHLLMLEAVAGRDLVDPLLRGRPRPRATAGTSSATATSSCPDHPDVSACVNRCHGDDPHAKRSGPRADDLRRSRPGPRR